MIVLKTYQLPPRFWHDHVARDCRGGRLVRETRRNVIVELDAEAYADLLSDADYYAAQEVVNEMGEFGLAVSARATRRILREEPFPVDVPKVRTAEPVLSQAQAAVLAWLCVGGGSGALAIYRQVDADVGQATLDSLVHLRLLERREAGARDPLYYLTALGRTHCVPQEDDHGRPATSLEEARPLHNQKENTMSATEVKPDPKPRSKPAAKKTAPDVPAVEDVTGSIPGPSPNPVPALFDGLVATLAAAIGGKAESKPPRYVRLLPPGGGSTVAYAWYPAARSAFIRVQVPRVGQRGYDLVKVAAQGDVDRAVQAAVDHLAAVTARSAEKAAAREETTAPAA